MKNTEKKLLGKNKYLLLGIGFLIGLGLLFYGNFGAKDKANDAESLPEAQAYRETLKEEIGQLCRQVEGVGKVTVLVSLEGGYEYVYARDEDGDCVSIGSGSGKTAAIENVLPPRIAGVGIVCDGGENAAVREALTALLSAALNIGANKIYITS